MPTALETRVARGRGIRFDERDLAQAIADFYLLETLANVNDVDAARPVLEELERELAAEFSMYLDIAIGGELRHAKSRLSLDVFPPELAPFFREVTERRVDRGTAWLVWSVIRRKHGLRALEFAEDVFRMDGWDRNFGGEAWAQVVVVLRAYLEAKLNRRIFVDRCFALEHNSGLVFDKLWVTTDARVALEAHGIDDYSTLLRFASKRVRVLWRRWERTRRADRDPIWLGIQPTETLEDLSLGVAY